MKMDIKCGICEELLGSLEKEQITEDDIKLYRQMTVCGQGHGAMAIYLEENNGTSEE